MPPRKTTERTYMIVRPSKTGWAPLGQIKAKDEEDALVQWNRHMAIPIGGMKHVTAVLMHPVKGKQEVDCTQATMIEPPTPQRRTHRHDED